MTSLVIDVPEELETQLARLAGERGIAVPALVRAALESLVVTQTVPTIPVEAESRDARAARIDAVLAGYGELPGSVDEFLRQKHEDTEREEQRLADRTQNGGSR